MLNFNHRIQIVSTELVVIASCTSEKPNLKFSMQTWMFWRWCTRPGDQRQNILILCVLQSRGVKKGIPCHTNSTPFSQPAIFTETHNLRKSTLLAIYIFTFRNSCIIFSAYFFFIYPNFVHFPQSHGTILTNWVMLRICNKK